MPKPAINPATFRSLDALNAELEEILEAAPKDNGTLDLIVMRPDTDERIDPVLVRGLTSRPFDHELSFVIVDFGKIAMIL